MTIAWLLVTCRLSKATGKSDRSRNRRPGEEVGLRIAPATELVVIYEGVMAIELLPISLPPSADPSKFKDFGREVRGVHPGRLTDEQFKEIEQLLYKVWALLPNATHTILLICVSGSMIYCSSETSIFHLRSSTN